MAQKCATMKARPLGKDEVVLLLDLIKKEKILTTKATNATNNRLKEQAWFAISETFSAHVGETRRPEQLRLKWENLKKAARKRSAAIRQNNLKTGGGKSFIVPDEVLDCVASMLGNTCSGFTVEFGGDGKSGDGEDLEQNAEVGVENFPPLADNEAEIVVTSGGGDGVGDGTFIPKKMLFNTPKSSVNKRRKLNEEVLKAQKEKELALASYFRAKTERIELENVKLKLEIEQFKNVNN